MKNDKRAERRDIAERESSWFDPFKVSSWIDPFIERMNAAIAESFKGLNSLYFTGFNVPKVDIEDKGDSFAVEVDLPGIKKDDIKLKVGDDTITIRADAVKEKEEEKKEYYAKERSSVGYYRVISLPEKVKRDTAKAKFNEGTLHIEVKKADESAGKEVKIE